MATIKITYTAPEVKADGKVMPISALFEPTNSYVDSEPYAGTVYDTNVDGFGTWDGIAAYMSSVTAHKGILLHFKEAVATPGTAVQFDVADADTASYYLEVGNALADQGFKVEVAGESA